MTLTYFFGSEVRGDEKRFSDRDALVISNSWNQATDEIESLNKLNCDITFFNLKKTKHLLNSGSLFFKHIIDEGELVQGNPKSSQQLLKNWSPKINYVEEIEHNIYLLETLEYLPKNDVSNLIGNDILIISIRNILIRRLACQGIYIFAWEEIFNKAIEQNLIAQKDKDLLLLSRIYKNMYRQGQIFLIENSFIFKLSSILEQITGKKININHVSNREIKKRTKLLSNYSYINLRYLEILASLYDSDDASIELKKLRMLTKNPNYVSNSNFISSSRNLAY